MICPLKPTVQTYVADAVTRKGCYVADDNCDKDCAWWDEKKGQCCIKTLAQKDNSKVSIAR